MQTQNFENHIQHDRPTYILGGLVVILGVFLAVLAKKLNTVVPLNGLQYFMPVFAPLVLLGVLVKARMYATKLQDRIIRQEVQFRYFVATGKSLPSSISIPQMVALRFAGDDEFVSLVDKVASNQVLTSKEIKQQVKNWKGDFNRV